MANIWYKINIYLDSKTIWQRISNIEYSFMDTPEKFHSHQISINTQILLLLFDAQINSEEFYNEIPQTIMKHFKVYFIKNYISYHDSSHWETFQHGSL